MLERDLLELVEKIQNYQTEFYDIEVKEAHEGCPKKLYDTISAFSNQNGGGTLVFGLKEATGFEEVGVYDPADLQKKMTEQCKQMSPIVRPVFTFCKIDNKIIMAAEIPEIDVNDKPCFYTGKGRLTGSYIRVGDSDEQMTEYEVYSYDAFRNKYQEDIRLTEKVPVSMLDKNKLDAYVIALKNKKTRLAAMHNEEIYELMGVTKSNIPTLAGTMMFCKYPQGYFPQFCMTAVVVPGYEVGEVGSMGERFIDNKRIDGTIPEMLEEAVRFVYKNSAIKTIIDKATGQRQDKMEYPMDAIREIILNALIHRDYSIQTEGIPIQLLLFKDRLEVKSPGGLYGRFRIDQIGKAQPDTRNPVIATMMEDLSLTENRYSGIPTIRRSMKEFGLKEPVFDDARNYFSVTLYNETANASKIEEHGDLVRFCRVPRSRDEITAYLGLKTNYHAMKKYILPLIEKGKLKYTIPDKPKSRNQRFIAD
ncbi:ATP-binding protein [Anaerosinus massiliensis]|uniref:ATP-binding protein n=1 Tax=Massilibacillus massiliensis TaxID=1806837 RepID=UPI000DA61802|nr:ATP-binding protein [Massilibacillus massiliensis]